MVFEITIGNRKTQILEAETPFAALKKVIEHSMEDMYAKTDLIITIKKRENAALMLRSKQP